MDVIQKHMTLYPSLKSEYENLGSLYSSKLYHELTIALSCFVTMPLKDKTDQKDNYIELYHELMKNIQDKLNPLKFIQIVIEISGQYNDPLQAIAFLQAILDHDVAHKEALLGPEAKMLCTFTVATMKLKIGSVLYQEQVKTLLELHKETIDGLVGADPLVHSSYYYTACQYYQLTGPAEAFYNNALIFLAYSPYELLKTQDRIELAMNISLAALTGEGVFNFGEVLANPILKALEGTDKQWLSDLLHAFNRGDIDTFNAIVGTHQQEYNSQPALMNKKEYIKEKVALLALIELVFHRPAHERSIEFIEIAQATRLPLEQVEWLTMRAMSVELIKGSIDQVDKVVRVTWVQPRVLDKQQMTELKDRLDGWAKKTHETLLFVEDQTPELFE